MRIRTGIALLLGLALAAQAKDSLEGKITSGKARKLVTTALPLLKKAQTTLTESARLGVDKGPEYEALLREAVKLFDEGTFLLNEALDIRYDGGVNGMLVNAARKLAWARARLMRLENERRFRDRPPARGPAPERVPERTPEPDPGPAVEPERAVPTDPEPEVAPERMVFQVGQPPARPVSVDLPLLELPESKEQVSREKRDRKSIARLIKAHFTARKKGKLSYDCKLCSGKGRFRDGSRCPDCRGAGRRINLHHFRKVYWTSYTPLLRDQPGALDALKAFYEHAASEPVALGAPVKTFKLQDVEYHGTWAKAKVQVKSTEGTSPHVVTLVGIGSSWFFFCPLSDQELLGIADGGGG